MNKAIIRRNYTRGLWTKEMLLSLVDKGKLSKDDYIEITDASPDEITPEMDLARAKETKAKELSWRRDKAINAGMTFSGMAIATDSESRGFITGAAVQAQLDPDYTCNWKASGQFVTLNAATILAVATAVREHVQAQFDKEAALLAQVGAAATVDGVKAVVWD
jgi:hypothetical protein